MELTASLLATLAGLALVDSLSIGTLAIPVWLMMAPRQRSQRVMLYIAVLGLFYFGVGGLVLLGVRPVLANLSLDFNDQRVLGGGLVLGVVLLGLSFVVDPPGTRRSGSAASGAGRLSRWRNRVIGGTDANGNASTSVMATPSIAVLALAAGAIELFTMLPYLAAVGLIAGSAASAQQSIGLLAGYCVVMLLPSLALLLARITMRSVLDGLLDKVDAAFIRHGASLMGWVLGIVGVILIVHTIRVVIPT